MSLTVTLETEELGPLRFTCTDVTSVIVVGGWHLLDVGQRFHFGAAGVAPFPPMLVSGAVRLRFTASWMPDIDLEGQPDVMLDQDAAAPLLTGEQMTALVYAWSDVARDAWRTFLAAHPATLAAIALSVAGRELAAAEQEVVRTRDQRASVAAVAARHELGRARAAYRQASWALDKIASQPAA